MNLNVHKFKKFIKKEFNFTCNGIIHYVPENNENPLELIAYFPDAFLPKSVIEAELPYMQIPFEDTYEGYYAVNISGDESSGEIEINSYKLLTKEDLNNMT